MSHDLMSKKLRNELREYFVTTTLRTIEMAFDEAGVECDEKYDPPEGGERRRLVERYYKSLDFTKWRDVRKFLTVLENVIQGLEDRLEDKIDWDGGQAASRHLTVLERCLTRDGLRHEKGRIVLSHDVRELEIVEDAAGQFDAPELHRQIDRIRGSVEDDPRLAIGSAKELIETTCKTILEQRKIPADPKWDFPHLLRETREALGLLPEQVDDKVRGAKVIQRILQALGSVGHGLAELRNLYGTGHGPKGNPRGLGPRHARLAAGTAATLAAFLLETHEERE